MANVIPNRAWRVALDWRAKARRFAQAAREVADRKWRERQAWEATYEAAAEEYAFERHCW